MLRLFLLLVTLPAHAMAPFVCDAVLQNGLKNKLYADPDQKTYTLTDPLGVPYPLFDARTACGVQPPGGIGTITCPLVPQIDEKKGFSVNLLCTRGRAPAFTTGTMYVQKSGKGGLMCYVGTVLKQNILLSNCK